MFQHTAQKYLARSLSVFPATSAKKPAIPAWAPYQTQIPSTKEIEAWSKDLGDMNIAIVCGRLSNLTVIDCDTPQAIQAVEELLPEGLELPIVTTPRGGQHYYFRYCPKLHSRNRANDGIDVKSEGGYVLAPPSKTESGVYTWNSEMNLDTIPERPPVPDALLTLLKAGTTNPVLPSPDKPILTQGTRDNYLYHAALQLLKDGRPRGEVEWIIVDMAKVCTPPFLDKEALAKVASAWKHYAEKNTQAPCLVRPAFTGTLTDFFSIDLPEAKFLIGGLLAREEFMFMGGVKHAHKTTAMMDLGLHYASGRKAWLNFPIPNPGRFLMVQQELGEYEFRKRLRKAVDAGHFEPDNFFPYTGTGDPIKIIEDEGFKRLCELCDRFKPDIVGLDPLHTFHTSNENAFDVLAKIRDRINYLKTTYNCAVITTHHFSSKRPQNDPEAPTEAGGWFRGHSVLSDSADVLFCLHRLPGQKDNPNLRLAYEDYNVVEITLRNGKWPPRFAIEFNEKTFLMNVSDVWHELGAMIEFGKIREVCDAHDGSILRTSLVTYFQNRLDGISESTVRRAVMREEKAGKVTTRQMPGRGHPMIVKSRRNP